MADERNRRDIEKPTGSLLECIKVDIALYEEGQDPFDLVDALRGIHRVLENIVASEKLSQIGRPRG